MRKAVDICSEYGVKVDKIPHKPHGPVPGGVVLMQTPALQAEK